MGAVDRGHPQHSLNTDTSPPSAHITIDNRLGAAISLAEQTRQTLRKILT